MIILFCEIVCVCVCVCVLLLQMRHRTANATKGSWDPVSMERAVEDVLKNSVSECKAANLYGVKQLRGQH